MKTLKKVCSNIYLIFIFVLLYAPILTLMVLSFNQSKSRARWGGFTTQWYTELFQNEEILLAFRNTMIIAFLSALIATLIGLCACMAMNNMKKRWRSIFMGIANIPMLNAEIVTGISLMLVFLVIGNFLSRFDRELPFGFWTVLIGHITFNIPYTILSIMPKLRQTSRYTYEAALDLGASPLYAFFKVVLPDIMPGVLSGFMMAFTMSLDDFVISYFTSGSEFVTLPIRIYSMTKRRVTPDMYALSTLIFGVILLLLVLINLLQIREEKKNMKQGARR